MLFEDLATELVVQIFWSCTSVTDVLALSSSCHRLHSIYSSSRKLAILERAAETQFGPLQDLTQLLTHNESQPAHILRQVPFSAALLKQIVHHGRVAEKWCEIYPFKKWKYNYENRRLLTTNERYRFRRALYRLWLYSRAFHNAHYPRETRATKLVVQRRAALLHNWSTWELTEIADVHAVLREVVRTSICPSNSTVARKFRKRYPNSGEHALLFNIHLNYPPPAPAAPVYYNNTLASPRTNTYYNASPLAPHFHTSSFPSFSNRTHHRFSPPSRYSAHPHTNPLSNPGLEGWGDDIPHYYVVESMLKLDPEQLLHLKLHAPRKYLVEQFVHGLGEWFENYGETWGETLEWVLDQRGEEVGGVWEEDEEVGVVGVEPGGC